MVAGSTKTARVVLSVQLTDDEGDTLEVAYDHDTTLNEAVDLRHNDKLILSCSLDELEAFAQHLISFVEHHRLENEQ